MDLLKARKKAKLKKKGKKETVKKKKKKEKKRKDRETMDAQIFEKELEKADKAEVVEAIKEVIDGKEEKKVEKKEEKIEETTIDLQEEVFQETEETKEEIPFIDIASTELYQKIEKEEEEAGVEYLVFNLGSEIFGVEIRNIREIVKGREMTEVPQTQDFILGICSVRGNIIPVVDIRRRLGLSDKKSEEKAFSKKRIILFSFDRILVGAIVDAVGGVLRVPSSELESVPPTIDSEKAEFLEGIVRKDKDLIGVINIERMFDFVFRQEEEI